MERRSKISRQLYCLHHDNVKKQKPLTKLKMSLRHSLCFKKVIIIGYYYNYCVYFVFSYDGYRHNAIINSTYVYRHLSMMSEYRSKRTSHWKLMTNWGLDMISFSIFVCSFMLSITLSCVTRLVGRDKHVTLSVLEWLWKLTVPFLLHNR